MKTASQFYDTEGAVRFNLLEAMSDAAKLDRHWHRWDRSATIASDRLTLLKTEIGGVPNPMGVRLAP